MNERDCPRFIDMGRDRRQLYDMGRDRRQLYVSMSRRIFRGGVTIKIINEYVMVNLISIFITLVKELKEFFLVICIKLRCSWLFYTVIWSSWDIFFSLNLLTNVIWTPVEKINTYLSNYRDFFLLINYSIVNILSQDKKFVLNESSSYSCCKLT